MQLPRLPERAPDSHKGTYGRAVLIGGSRGMAGAIALSGMAALRSGAGLVRLGVPSVCLETVASFEPCYTTTPLENDAVGQLRFNPEPLQALCAPATCVAFGPGLGSSAELGQLAAWLYRTLPQPLVIDADGLNALALHNEPLARAAGPRILTPHPGEFLRLTRLATSATWDELAEQATLLAGKYGVVIVLKGHRSLITDGTQSLRNTTGNPGMATGGSGDVLTGILTALVCQGLAPLAAAQLGCHVHGLAGDLAAAALGEVSLTARDLIAHLPAAFQLLTQQRAEGEIIAADGTWEQL